MRLVAKRSLEGGPRRGGEEGGTRKEGGPRREGRWEERREGQERRERQNTGEIELEFGDSQIDSSTYCSSLALNLV